MKWMWIPALVICLSGAALGTTGEQAGKPLETVTIIASRERLAGSGSVIGAVELEKFHYTDIHRILAFNNDRKTGPVTVRTKSTQLCRT